VSKPFSLHHLITMAALALLAACGPSADEPAAEQAAPSLDTAAATATTDSMAATQARLYFKGPADGDVVSNPVAVTFGIDGMAVVPAGQDAPHSGHHHLIIDAGLPDLSLPVPADANYVHFGDGSSSTELTLEPGTHTLQLLFADFLHIPHDPPVISDQITITVE
jgi:hypothetical protein